MLDLEHLSHQTQGNRSLEREVLDLFVVQIDGLIERLRCGGRQERSDTAHLIVGSAAAIGAFDVARIAGRIESTEGSADDDIAELVAAVEQTRECIAARLAR